MKRSVIAIRNETDFLAIVFFGDRQSEFSRQLPHFGLFHAAQREQRAGELRLR